MNKIVMENLKRKNLILEKIGIDYKKIIPYIEYFSSKVTRALSEEETRKQIKQTEEEAD